MSRYTSSRDAKYEIECEELLDTLPECCRKYINSKGLSLTVPTKRAYLRRYKEFFSYLCRDNELFYDYELKDIPTELLKEITNEDIINFLSDSSLKTISRTSDPLSNITKENMLAALSSFFTYLVKNDDIRKNPVKDIQRMKPQKHEIISLNFDERKILLDGVKNGTNLTEKEKVFHKLNAERDYAIMLFFLDTGVRISELIGVDLDDLDFNEPSVVVTRKGNHYDKVMMSDDLVDALFDYLDIRKDRYDIDQKEKALFVSKNGRIGKRTIQDLVYKYVKANIPLKADKISAHKLRSTFAMNMLEKHGNVSILQKQLGHKRIETTTLYAEAQAKDLLAVRNMLSDKETSAVEDALIRNGENN